jgi:hypothetical protein
LNVYEVVRPGATLANHDLRPGLLPSGSRVADADASHERPGADTERYAFQHAAVTARDYGRLALALLGKPGFDARGHCSIDAINECLDHRVAVLRPELAVHRRSRPHVLGVNRRGTHCGRITRQALG